MKHQTLSPEQMNSFNRDGYVVVKGFCQKEEVDLLLSTAVNDDAMRKNALDLNDQTGKKTRLSLWFTPGKDVFGYLTRSERMVNGVAQLMDREAPVGHCRSKLMQKEPRVGGAWDWQPDSGSWS
jgi:hypothetical protein